jgi:T1SS-143 domain-containing protein
LIAESNWPSFRWINPHLVDATATPTDDEGTGVFAALSNEGVGTGAAGSDVNLSPATVSGGTGALFQVGADGFGSVTVSGPAGLEAIWDQDGDGDAQQENVVYDALSTAADGTVTLTARGADSGAVVFTLVIYNDGSYLFTQSAALVQPTANNEDNLNLQFNFTVTDGDGDAASNTLTVAVDDDTPVVHADTDSVVVGAGNIADGNVITGSGGSDVNGTDGIADSAGADGLGGVLGVAAGNTGVDLVNATTVGVQITGTYGKLTLNADGSYSYDPNENIASATNVQDVFTYTMSDGDGDLAHTTLTITIDVAPFALDLPGLDDLQGNGLNKDSTLGTFASGFTYSLAEDSSPGFALSPDGVLSTGSDNVGSGIYTLYVNDGSGTPTIVNIWVGTTGNDTFDFATMFAIPGDINLAYGLNGVDVITGDGGFDFIVGGQQSNTLNASSGTTTLVAGPQGDTLTAGSGADIFYGAGGGR